MKYKNMLLLLISSVILAGCDPQPGDEKNQQPEHAMQQAAAREAAAKAVAEAKAAAEAKIAAKAKAAAEAEALVAELNADKRSLQGSVRYAAQAKAPK